MVNLVSSQNESDFSSITHIIHTYFEGLHFGDIVKLKAIFHKDAWLKSPGSRRSLAQWIHDVSQRATPEQLNKPFEYQILALDIVQDQAMVKIHCPLFEFNYIDFLGLLKEDGQWLIVNKMYTHVSEK